MEIFIDADGCPVVKQTISIAAEYKIPVSIICDTAHNFDYENVNIVKVDKGSDSADFKLIDLIQKGDIAVTQDYGLAAMCLAKKAFAINQNGLIYNDDNIDSLLYSRYTAKKIRRSGGRIKGPAKRTEEQNIAFVRSLKYLINNNM